MTSTRPYLIRAFYEWITDNNLTPYLVVNASYPHVEVPVQFVEGGEIVLNISHKAVQALQLNNDSISFQARFGGILTSIQVPPQAVLAIYARENGRGMVFAEEEVDDTSQLSPPPLKPIPPGGSKKRKAHKPSHLTVIK